MDTQKIAEIAEQIYRQMPDMKVEVISGAITMQAAPAWENSFIASRADTMLKRAYEVGGSFVLPEPGVTFPEGSELRPDIAVVHCLPESGAKITAAMVELVVEVASPSNSVDDYVKKAAIYAAAAIPEYLIIDPTEGRCVYLAKPAGREWMSRTEYVFGEDVKMERLTLATDTFPRTTKTAT